jgi:hypothetical protein
VKQTNPQFSNDQHPGTAVFAGFGPLIEQEVELATAPRWQAAWWRSSGFLGGFISGLEHRPTLASSVVT